MYMPVYEPEGPSIGPSEARDDRWTRGLILFGGPKSNEKTDLFVSIFLLIKSTILTMLTCRPTHS